MATWQAIVDGTTYNLSNGSPFKVISVSGIGNAPVRRLEERGPFQDGVTDVGYRFDPRLINMVIGVHSSSLSNADTNRDTLSAIFNPVGGRTIYLRCTRDDSAVRQIDCYAVNMVDMPAEIPERMLAFQRVGVQLKAPNPMWYDPTIRGVTFSSSVPAWYTGDGQIGTANVVAYSGTPAAGSTTAFAGTLQGWSVYLRANADIPSAGAGQRGLFYVGSNGTAGPGGWYTAGTAGPGGTWNARVSTHSNSGDVDFGTGSVDMWFKRPSNYDGVIFHNGTAQVGAINTYSPTTGIWFDLDLAGSVVWGSVPAGNSWSGTITHAALYNYALTDAEREAVRTAITTPTTRMIGTATVSGSWEDYPVITLTGPMNDPVVENMATSETLDFTGSTISAGQVYEIDLRYGYKTVKVGGSSIINKLSNDSDLATFHLTPGMNALRVTHTGGTSAASGVVVAYYDRYLGL